MSYKTELREIATILGLRNLPTNADGSKVEITPSLVVETVRDVVAKLERLQTTLDERSKNAATVPPPPAPPPPAPAPAPPAPAANKRKVVEPAHVETRKRRKFVVPSQIGDAKMAVINNEADFPENLNFTKLQIFKGDQGEELVTVGFGKHRAAFSTKCIHASVLLDHGRDASTLQSAFRYYRSEWVAKQIGNIDELQKSRTQKKFWAVFGGPPRVVEVNVSSYGGWCAVRVVDFVPRRRKFPILLECVDAPPAGKAHRFTTRCNFALFRERVSDFPDGS